MAGASEVELVTLKGGITCPVAPILLLLSLEGRGFSVRQEGDGLIVQPYQQLTAEDCQAIRRWKPHLIAVLNYTPPEVH